MQKAEAQSALVDAAFKVPARSHLDIEQDRIALREMAAAHQYRGLHERP